MPDLLALYVVVSSVQLPSGLDSPSPRTEFWSHTLPYPSPFNVKCNVSVTRWWHEQQQQPGCKSFEDATAIGFGLGPDSLNIDEMEDS
mmetsp:Transcript_14856/g.19014  ORF Transcript_14856/g.19014 Transcript_14856/m.19014 type:complete len:88 (-) Transcript_14856:31-294(-)